LIEVHWVPFHDALAMARSDEIIDAKSVAGLFRAAAVVVDRTGDGTDVER
jgi:hypothetical protein